MQCVHSHDCGCGACLDYIVAQDDTVDVDGIKVSGRAPRQPSFLGLWSIILGLKWS
jgi:hypothetical protein